MTGKVLEGHEYGGETEPKEGSTRGSERRRDEGHHIKDKTIGRFLHPPLIGTGFFGCRNRGRGSHPLSPRGPL